VAGRGASRFSGGGPGATGTARSQDQLRQSLKSIGCYVMPAPEFLLNRANEKFDDNGTLTDEKTLRYLEKFLQSFEEWVDRF
jgi:chromate reductase, NAD(P)H dehydrogenase (quinone)